MYMRNANSVKLTEAQRAKVSILAKGHFCGLGTTSEVFNFLFIHIYTNIVEELTRGEYCCINSPSMQYFMLLTSGW